MPIRASDLVTLAVVETPSYIRTYYRMATAAAPVPAKPTTNPPSGWTTTEPTYTAGSTDVLYTVQLTVWSNGTFDYGDVSKSASFEAAKTAYNLANQANNAALLAAGGLTTSTADPTLADGNGKPIGAVWETTVSGTTTKRFVWTGSIWQQVKIGSALVADEITGKTITGGTITGTIINGVEFSGAGMNITAPIYNTSLLLGSQSVEVYRKSDGRFYGGIAWHPAQVTITARDPATNTETAAVTVGGNGHDLSLGTLSLGSTITGGGRATDAEVLAGTRNDKIVTPASLVYAQNRGSYRYIMNNPDLPGSSGISVPSGVWTPLGISSVVGVYTVINTLDNGQPVPLQTVSGQGNFVKVPRTGRYLVNTAVRFTGATGGTARGVSVRVGTNGARQMEASQRVTSAGFPAYNMPMSTTAEVMCNAGDIIQPLVTQNTGSNNIVWLETFTISYLGPA